MIPAIETVLITHDGRTQTLAAWARELGIKPSAFCARLTKKWPEAEVFQPYVSHGARGRAPAATVTHPETGVTKTIRAWADEAGLSYVTLYHRLLAGWDVARALVTPVGAQRDEVIVCTVACTCGAHHQKTLQLEISVRRALEDVKCSACGAVGAMRLAKGEGST